VVGGDTLPVFLSLVVGFCTFYVLEQFIHWHHHHAASHDREPVTYLVLLSDTLHNFIDGLVIAGSFVVGVPVGIVTTLAIALHEVPQEIGDFGVLVYGVPSLLLAFAAGNFVYVASSDRIPEIEGE